jgi:hypothetical protein
MVCVGCTGERLKWKLNNKRIPMRKIIQFIICIILSPFFILGVIYYTIKTEFQDGKTFADWLYNFISKPKL